MRSKKIPPWALNTAALLMETEKLNRLRKAFRRAPVKHAEALRKRLVLGSQYLNRLRGRR